MRGLGNCVTGVFGDRGWLKVALGLFILASLATGSIACRHEPELTPPIQARLDLAAGEVTLDSGKGAEPVYSGAALPAEAVLGTGTGARALARLSDGSTLFLRGETVVQLGSDTVDLTQGEVWLDAPPTDQDTLVYSIGEVTISATDAGLSIKKDAAGMTSYVARGLAVVSAPGGRVEVQAGEQVRVEGANPPDVSPVAFWADWTGGMADNPSVSEMSGTGTGVIYGVDFGGSSGSSAQKLDLARLSVRATIRSGLAETEVDQTFVNHGERDLEGWYWFSVPPGATVTSFAVENHGILVEGEFIEKKEAAAKYQSAAVSGYQPAILEWVDGRTFRARIYPVPAMGERRIVLRYLERLDVTEGVMRYYYPLQSDEPVRIGEFALTVDLGDAGTDMRIATLADARIEQGGRLVTMRRSGFSPRADFQLEATMDDDVPPMRASRFEIAEDSADYVMVRYTPDIDWDAFEKRSADVVVVVDTSAAGDETSRQFKSTTAEAILRALSEQDRFALLSLDVDSQVLHPEVNLAPANEDEITAALESLADHSTGGATDLAAFFDVALNRLHEGEQPAVIYVGDGLATSGELTGEQLRERLRRTLSTSPARLFTVAVGNDANHVLLSELARTGGGQSFRVDHADEATERALRLAAAIKTPTITELEIDVGAGLDDVFITGGGKVSHGEEVILLARTHHDLPDKITVRGMLAGEEFEQSHRPKVDRGAVAAFVPRFWAQEYMQRLLGAVADPQEVRGEVAQLGIDYGLMTPFTSILALENEAVYYQMGIPRRHSPLRGIRLSSLSATTPSGSRTAAADLGGTALLMGCMSVFGGEKEDAVSDWDQGGYGAKDSGRPVMSEEMPEPAASIPDAPAGEVLANYADGEMEEGAMGIGNLAGSGGATGDPGLVGRQVKGGVLEDKASLPAPEQERRQARRDRPGSIAIASAVPQTCSDWASRPLSDRLTVWKKRLRTAEPGELLDRYLAASRACELPDWRSESAFLRMLVRRIDSEAEAVRVLDAFQHDPGTQQYIARLILRGTVDQRIVDAVQQILFGTRMNWNHVDLELSAIKDLDERIEVCRQYLAMSPDDPEGALRLIRLLAKAGNVDELLVQCRRLQDQGMMTPLLAREMGDLLALHGLEEEAVRSYSEIVEFHPESLPSRQLLGDIYLANGWYDQAYRQYNTITDENPGDSLAWLRLAAAAAGEGRVDEALRIERKVASASGNPGVEDPRGWARLWSAARIVRLIDSPPPSSGTPPEKLAGSLRRKLKELQIFRAPGTLVILTWEDLGSDIALATYRQGKAAVVGDATDATQVGLAAVLLPRGDLEQAEFKAHLRTLPQDRPIKLVRHDITWDGSDFQIQIREYELAPAATEIEL